jgi:ABC-type phosphate/phosphonate transport system substrate-binding protein
VTEIRVTLAVLTIVGAAGWIAAGYQASRPCPHPAPQVIVREVTPDYPVKQAATPLIDSLISDEEWDEIERQSDCLFEFLKAEVGHEITLERVLAAGYWTDALGGACLVIGEDNE